MGTYNQSMGRPHSGLANPERFGLTYEEVVQLITEGEWKNFLEKWNANQRKLRRIEAYGYQCPKCSKLVEDPDLWLSSGKKCINCDSRRAGIERKEGKTPRKKKIILKSNRRLCYMCRRQKLPAAKVMGNLVCKDCLRKYRKLKDAISATRRAKRVRNSTGDDK